MDLQTVQAMTRSTVQSRLTAQSLEDRAFTSVDISLEIAQAEMVSTGQSFRTFRHSDVRRTIGEMFANDELVAPGDVFDDVRWVRTRIPVANGESAFLYHDPDFDASTYNRRDLVLPPYQTDPATALPPPRLNPPPTRAPLALDDNLSAPTSPADPIPTAGCSVQAEGDTLNVPRVFIKGAEWHSGDKVAVRLEATANCNAPCVRIYKDQDSHKQVDAEGRIRIHAEALVHIRKHRNDVCTVMLVEDQGRRFIEIR